jgi:hypothetical protein
LLNIYVTCGWSQKRQRPERAALAAVFSGQRPTNHLFCLGAGFNRYGGFPEKSGSVGNFGK